MASPTVDPYKVKYFPEMLIECLNEPSVSTSGEKVASYHFDDRRCVVENIEIENADIEMIVSADSAEKARIRADSPVLRDRARYHKITAKDTLDMTLINMSAPADTDVWSRWNMTFRKPMPVDKIREGRQLDTEEGPIADLVHLEDFLSLGTISYYQSLANIDPSKMFEDVIPVDKITPVIAAGGEAIVGGTAINVPNPNSQLIVLLGVSFDSSAMATADDTFVVVDRDADVDYMKLDVTGMPDNGYLPCYVPATKKLEVRVESTTGIVASPCGFYYGVRKMNVGDHIRWNLGFPNAPLARSEAQQLIAKYPDIAKRMQAGLI